MTAGARSYSDLNQTADELWADAGDRPTGPPNAAALSPSRSAGRYAEGAIISGKYQLSEVLGEGGMGSVWLAKNRTLDVDVALKLMRAELSDEVDGVAERMLQEARAAACIGHPAIIQVFDFGFTEAGDPFIAMELLRGESLAQALRRRGRVLPQRAVQTLLPIVDALGAAHARGIVHRDLKPENIFLARPPGNRLQPKVLDFGIAKLEQRAAERLTRDGAVIGSPAYMSPEQLRGDRDVDARADIWALSVVLYEMVSGHRPFEGDGYQAAIWWNVIHSDPRPLSEHGLDDEALWAIIARGLAKDAAARYQSMQAFGRELASYLLERGIHEDICDASLRGWLSAASSASERQHSFFPSLSPSAEPSPVVVADPLAQLLQQSLETSGTRPIPEPGPALEISVSRAPHHRSLWWVTLGAALAAFLAAAGLAAWHAQAPAESADTESEPTPSPRPSSTPRATPPRAALESRTAEARAVPAAPDALERPAPALESEPAVERTPSLGKPSSVSPPPVARSGPSVRKRSPHTATVKARTAELKNPF